jgi:hypothetical protein|tara:strand:- start:1296 stop:2081 length:786 start_codon:yes stop_codon:yes gene_type:complete
MEVVRSYQCENLLDLVETYTVDCDWKVLLTEARTCLGLWESSIAHKATSSMHGKADEWDMSMSKNAYNLISLSSTMPEFFSLWNQVFRNIRKYPGLETKPLWIHAWMNVHRAEQLGKMSLGWHNHSYCGYHGFIHLSQKETTTVFSNVIPQSFEERDEHTLWYLDAEDRTKHPLDETITDVIRIDNQQGLQYIGPGPLMHKVIPGDYPGVRVSIGYDIIDDLNWLPLEQCHSDKGLCQFYPVFERQEDLFNTKLIPIPVYG